MKSQGQEYRSAEVQGYKPDKQTKSDHEETLVVFPTQEKLGFEQRTGQHDGTVRQRRWLYLPIDVGPNPHTQENVVVYLLKEKILFQGDLFHFDVGDTFPHKDRATIMPFFAK